jgi:hypothetical protein
MDPDISREIFAEAVSLTNTYARGLLQREGMTWGPLPSARNRLEQAMRVGTSGTSAAATPWLLAGRDAGAVSRTGRSASTSRPSRSPRTGR